MRRLVVALVAVVVMATAAVAVAPQTTQRGGFGTEAAEAQVPGQTVHCGRWHLSWYVSNSGWWYSWWWRWCYNPSIQGGWYVDWAGWQRDGYAGGQYSPGFQYNSQPAAGAVPGSTPGFQSESESTPGRQYETPPQQ